MLRSNLEAIDELPDCLQSCENRILPSKGIFSKEDLESCLFFMLIALEVGVGAGELIEIV